TGLSLWGAIGEAIRRQLLPQRALSSLKNFQQLIEDGRAMQAGTFVEHLHESVAADDSPAETPETKPVWGQPPSPALSGAEGAVRQGEALPPSGDAEDATDFDPTAFGNFSFDFGASATESPAGETDPSVTADVSTAESSPNSTDSFPTSIVSTADLLKFLIDRT